MIRATFRKYSLQFIRPGGTSRGILHTKETYFLKISDGQNVGIGECAVFKGLSADDRPDYEEKLNWLCENINKDLQFLIAELMEFPSIQFGLEQAFMSIQSKNAFELFPSNFTKELDSIAINGLIWMGEKQFMLDQIKQKLESGFHVIKLKIGAIDFGSELEILKGIRKDFSAKEIEIRVDANGAFKPEEALEKLKKLSDYNLHSIEQPIKAGQLDEMADLCERTPLPIALDEELIGIFKKLDKERTLQIIKPQYVILKPSLVGGFLGTNEWIEIAKKNNIDWWITSALESNIGLNAIAQYTYTLQNKMPQGLGTGGLFNNNIASPLYVKNGALNYNVNKKWNTTILNL